MESTPDITDSGMKTTALTYAEALDAVRRARGRVLLHFVDPDPSFSIDPVTQVKLVTVTGLMNAIGALPGDFPRVRFQRAVRYRRLSKRSQEWLEKWRIPVRREFAPLAAQDYRSIFGRGNRLPVSENDGGRFFGRLIHCLVIETQILLARQYYHGLGLYHRDVAFSILSEAVPSDVARGLKQASPDQIEFDQFHGRIFLEYCAVMIRAQWDKLTHLSCLVLGLPLSWDSISEGLQALEQKLASEGELHPWCRRHFRLFTTIAKDRVAKDGWLKRFRDPLLHDVGPHSAGVVPHIKSLETTSEMWDKVCDEHDWLREGMMAALAAFISFKVPVNHVA